MSFPWQMAQWQQLISAKQRNKLPHALLLLGLQGMGKKEFAIAFAKAILCSEFDAQGHPCQTCHACHLTRANSHPDLLLIEPEQAGRIIKIDQIREVIHLANETSQQGGFKVIIINPASAMNINAANALLKTLEEPALRTIFILLGDPNLRLPATIISRCQKILFARPSTEMALAWLALQLPDATGDLKLLLDLAEGAPLKARDLLASGAMTLRQELYQGLMLLSQKQADPLQLATQWQEADASMFFNLLLSWLKDLLRFQLTDGKAELINKDYQSLFAQLGQKITRQNVLRYIDLAQKSYASIIHSHNLNRQLLLEELFIYWIRYVSC